MQIVPIHILTNYYKFQPRYDQSFVIYSYFCSIKLHRNSDLADDSSMNYFFPLLIKHPKKNARGLFLAHTKSIFLSSYYANQPMFIWFSCVYVWKCVLYSIELKHTWFELRILLLKKKNDNRSVKLLYKCLFLKLMKRFQFILGKMYF